MIWLTPELSCERVQPTSGGGAAAYSSGARQLQRHVSRRATSWNVVERAKRARLLWRAIIETDGHRLERDAKHRTAIRGHLDRPERWPQREPPSFELVPARRDATELETAKRIGAGLDGAAI